MVDKQIIQSAKKGNHRAFECMYKNCISYVYSIVIRYVANQSEHADIIQEIFARLFLSIDSYNEKRGAFKPWLRQLTINQCIMHYRKTQNETKVIPIDNAMELESGFETRINEISKEEMEVLLHEMPDGYRQIFMMIIIDEYSHKEVSQMLEISIDTSRSQLSRAKKWIRKNIFDNRNKILANGF